MNTNKNHFSIIFLCFMLLSCGERKVLSKSMHSSDLLNENNNIETIEINKINPLIFKFQDEIYYGGNITFNKLVEDIRDSENPDPDKYFLFYSEANGEIDDVEIDLIYEIGGELRSYLAPIPLEVLIVGE